MAVLSPEDLIAKFEEDIESEVIYTSTIGNVHSLYSALVNKNIENAYISKVGDILNTEMHYKGANSAAHAENNGTLTISSSSAKTDGLAADAIAAYNNGNAVLNDVDILTKNDMSAGLLVSTNSNMQIEDTTVYTLGSDSPAIYTYDNGNITINNSSIGTESTNVIEIIGDSTIEITDTIIYNNPEKFFISAKGGPVEEDNSGHFNLTIDSCSFEEVGPILDVMDTNPDTPNEITIRDTEFSPLEELDYTFELLRANSNFTFIDSCCSDNEGRLFGINDSNVNIDCSNSDLSGDIDSNDESEINLTIGERHSFTGAIRADNCTVSLDKYAVWNLTGDTSIKELDLDYTSIINKNDHILLIDGEDYTDGIVVGSIVHYTTKAEKVYDREILERNCIVLSISISAEGANEFIIYDADDRLAYKVGYSEFRNTGKVVDIEPILDEIEDLLIDIEKYFSDTNLRSKDENTNVMVIDSELYNLDNLVIEKYNGAADEDRGDAGENAAVLVTNGGDLTLTNSNIITDGWYATGVYVTEESTLSLDNVNISTQYSDSRGIDIRGKSTANIVNTIVNTIQENSDCLAISEGSQVTTENDTFEASGLSYALLINNNLDDTELVYQDTDSTFDSNGRNAIKIISTNNATSSITFNGSKINTNDSNNTITSLIKCNGNTTDDVINIDLQGAELTNPSHSVAFFNIDPVTVNISVDENTIFNQLNYDADFLISNNSIINYTATNSVVEGKFHIDNASILNLDLIDSVFNGVINPTQEIGEVNIKLVGSSVWNLSTDEYVHSVDIDANSVINLNGYSLFIDGRLYNPITDINDEYQEVELPTGRILKVITANEYSAIEEKEESYVYFLYDKLEMWFDGSKYNGPFCIVEKLPEDPQLIVPDILYINYQNGKMYIYNDYEVKEVGYVEHLSNGESDPAQLAILSAAGTTYFHYAETRYIDIQTRTVIIPYQNGSYQICVNIPEDLRIDENTIIYYNTTSEQWEVSGVKNVSEFDIPDYYHLTPGNSESVLTTIYDNKMIRSDVRISPDPNNIIETTINGIYVDGSNFADSSEFDDLKTLVYNYRAVADGYMMELRDAVNAFTASVSIDVIEEKIHTVFLNYESTIDDMFDLYDMIYNRLIALESSIDFTLDEKINNAKQDILDYLNNITNPWHDFQEDITITPISDEQLRHTSAALAYGREQIVNANVDHFDIVYVSALPNEEDALINTIYAIWDSESETYSIFVWNHENENWDPFNGGITTAMPAEEEVNYYKTTRVISIDQTTNMVNLNQDAIEGFVYITPDERRYLFTGSSFMEVTPE